MVTIGIARWTPESANEMGKRAAKTEPIPDFIKTTGPYMYPDENEGIKSIMIFKYDKARAGEASEAMAKGFMQYYGVPGYRYSLHNASGSAATLKMMGL